MAMIEVRGLSFSYLEDESRTAAAMVLQDVELTVEEGAFCLVVGPTGCGKSTLLRLMKPEIRPRGHAFGSILLDGMAVVEEGEYRPVDHRTSASLVGFVAQDPEAQIVCDTVRAELAFGLESLGIEPGEMRRRIAEVAGYLDVGAWLDRRTADLSGGQKQLLNLACVLAMQPRVLLLDEPTAQLDPQSRHRFIDVLSMLNQDLGITVVMSTHEPELLESQATQLFELGELAPAMPYGKACAFAGPAGRADPTSIIVEVREVDFRYQRHAPWVLRDATLAICAGRAHALMGGNGSGKTTLLKLLAGICKPQRGKVRAVSGLRRAYLPQDPKALFSCDSVEEELHEWHARFGYRVSEEQAVARRFQLEAMAGQHPYDLSGGQQQQLAIAKLLLAKPDVLFLDEPTKGLDAHAAASVTRVLHDLARGGCAIIVATHDVPFVRALADEVSLVFDGAIACSNPTDEFFKKSLVYRTDAPARLYGALR